MPSAWQSPSPPHPRVGDEICVAGQWIHTDCSNKVVTWIDVGGFDAYAVTPELPLGTAPGATATQLNVAENQPGVKGPVVRYGSRRLKQSSSTSSQPASPPRGPAGALVTDLSDLRKVITQLVIHHDGCGTSKKCFKVLHEERGLSCHFLIDVDGRIFQTLDLMERAWHATDANDVSIGVELASLGAFREPEDVAITPFDVSDSDNCIEGRDFVRGEINGDVYVQQPYTDKQMDSVTKLYATLLKTFPYLKLGYPLEDEQLESDGSNDAEKVFMTYQQVLNEKLTDERRRNFCGALGHFHVQRSKCDPGPAIDWGALVVKTKELLGDEVQGN